MYLGNEDSIGTHYHGFRDNLSKLNLGPSAPFLKHKGVCSVCASRKKTSSDALSSLKQRSLGVYFDLLEFQREEYPLWATLLDPEHLKGPCIHMFGDCFGGPRFFTKASKNNGIIIALTTRGNGKEGEEDAPRQAAREGEEERSGEGERE